MSLNPGRAGGVLAVLVYKWVYENEEDRNLTYKIDAQVRKAMRQHVTNHHDNEGTKKDK